MDTLKDLSDKVNKFREDRGFNLIATTRDLAISVSIEAAELLEHFQWSDYCNKTKAVEEMADVLVYLLALSNALDIDMFDAVVDKLAKNEIKYPLGANDENS